jgi:hypothetical protein
MQRSSAAGKPPSLDSAAKKDTPPPSTAGKESTFSKIFAQQDSWRGRTDRKILFENTACFSLRLCRCKWQ